MAQYPLRVRHSEGTLGSPVRPLARRFTRPRALCGFFGSREIQIFGSREIQIFGVTRILRPGNPESWVQNTLNIKILFIQIHSAPNVGKVWISRKKIILATFGAI